MTTLDPRWAEQVAVAAPGVGAVRLVCIDGPSGSGKTTTAAALAGALEPLVGEVPVVHGDELYEGWAVVAEAPDRLAAFAALAARVDTWLLEPWRRGSAGAHPRWDWHAGRWGGAVDVPVAPVVILAGVALGSRPLRAQAALSVWVEAADDDVRLPRVLARDGEALRSEMERWLVDEAAWHRQDGTRDGADARLVT